MDILIIGGTRFLGRALVEAAQARGHQVTLFNRGKSNPDVYPDIETIRGDREIDLHLLDGRTWDAVIDTCGYTPRIVTLSAQSLKDKAKQYTFISTISVYPIEGTSGRDESAELLPMNGDDLETVTNENYGPLKVLCEQAVETAFPDHSLIIRPGLIVGPHDPTNRFTYWVTRTAKGGAAIAPPANQAVQFVDARDLAQFTISRIEADAKGVYNVTGPDYRLTFGKWLETCAQVIDSDVQFHHVGDEFLLENEIGQFMELPLWVTQGEAESFMSFDVSKAIGDGLRFRPLGDTVRDTLIWAQTLPDDAPKQANLPVEKEDKLLNALRVSGQIE